MFTQLMAGAPAAAPVVYAFPHAGAGAAAMMPLAEAATDRFSLRCIALPGRLERLSEPVRTRFQPLAEDIGDALAADLAGRDDSPYALLGSCGGAYLVLEAARVLRRMMVRPPAAVLVASAAAPDVAPVPHRIGTLPSQALWDYLLAHDGVPAELYTDPAFRTLTEPALRADFQLFADYRHLARPPLDTDLVVLHGELDDGLRLGELLGWRRQSSRPLRMVTVPKTGRWLLERDPAPVADLIFDLLNNGEFGSAR